MGKWDRFYFSRVYRKENIEAVPFFTHVDRASREAYRLTDNPLH